MGNAGKIGYEVFTPGALDIIGAGTGSGNRKSNFWPRTGQLQWTCERRREHPCRRLRRERHPRLISFDDGDYVSIGENGADDRMELTAAQFVFKGGRVGIGIGAGAPGLPLPFADVPGDKISLFGQSGNTYGFGIQSLLLQIHTAVSGEDIAFGHGSSGAFTERMRIKGSGNVGIGTNAPATKLHLVGSGDTELSIQSLDNNRRWTLQASGGPDGNPSFLGGYFQIIDRTAGASRLRIETNGKVTISAELTTTAINITSDRNAKEQFKPVNAREVLAKVARLPISEWQYKAQSDAGTSGRWRSISASLLAGPRGETHHQRRCRRRGAGGDSRIEREAGGEKAGSGALKKSVAILMSCAALLPGVGWSAQVVTNWAGLAVGQGTAADPHGAAGSNGILEVSNFGITYRTRTGAQIWTTNEAGFFQPTVCCDAKALHDPVTQRFFLIAQARNTTAGSASNLFVNVSRNSNARSAA